MILEGSTRFAWNLIQFQEPSIEYFPQIKKCWENILTFYLNSAVKNKACIYLLLACETGILIEMP
jgi:hypothetical protein